MKKILLIGPLPKPTTGVSLANQVVIANLQKREGFLVNSINTSFSKFDENLGAFSLSKLFFYLRLNFYSYKIFISDIVYITPGQTFYGVLKYAIFICLSKLLRKEIIMHIHGNYIGTEYASLEGIKKVVFKNLISQTSKGIVLSESLSGNMAPFVNKNKIFVLYNFVENYLFTNKETMQEKLKTKTPRIIFLSNLMEEKGIFELLQALTILEKEGFEYEARIAGNVDPIHSNKIQEYFSKLKRANYIGVVSGQKKKDLLLWGNIFVLPTFYKMEGQPISILEAMATGNLVLTTNHAGINDIFKDQINGFYVVKKEPQSIVLKIKEVVSNLNESNDIRTNNYKYALKNYKVDNFINNFINIVES